MSLVQRLVDFWDEYGDKRMSQWLLTKNLYSVTIFIAVCLFISRLILPKIFKGKKHPKVRPFLAFYYSLICIIELLFIAAHIYAAIEIKMNWRCEPTIQAFEGLHYQMAVAVYLFVCLKTIEMFEIFLLIIVNGSVPFYIEAHHSMTAFLIAFLTHFYAGGTPIVFGLFLNIGHTLKYFVVIPRTLSQKFKKNSDPWFKKFYLIETCLELILAAIYYMMTETRDDCDYVHLKSIALFSLITFFFVSNALRWNFISRPDAFGETAFVRFINEKILKQYLQVKTRL